MNETLDKMGKKARGRGVQVRLDGELIRKAKYVAGSRGKTLQAYLHEKLARAVDFEFRRVLGLPDLLASEQTESDED